MDTEATAKALLARGQLRNRITIVPLNKARLLPYRVLGYQWVDSQCIRIHVQLRLKD